MNEAVEELGILFSGGRDSTLVAAMALSNPSFSKIHLLTMNTGLGWGPNLRAIRIRELQERFPHKEIMSTNIDVRGAVKEIALVSIEQDFSEFGVNTIPLGETLAVLLGAIHYCKKSSLCRIQNGYTLYQRHFSEQTSASRAWLVQLAKQFGIRLESPLAAFSSEEDVKKLLRLLNISPKSMERNYMFADSFTVPCDESIVKYYETKKILAESILAFWQTGSFSTQVEREN